MRRCVGVQACMCAGVQVQHRCAGLVGDQVLRVLVVQMGRCADVQVCRGMQGCKYVGTRIPLCGCAGIQLCRCAGVPVCRCAGVQVCRCAGVQVCRYARVHVCSCAREQVRRCVSVGCTGVQMRRHVGMQAVGMFWKLQVCRCAGVQVYRYAGLQLCRVLLLVGGCAGMQACMRAGVQVCRYVLLVRRYAGMHRRVGL